MWRPRVGAKLHVQGFGDVTIESLDAPGVFTGSYVDPVGLERKRQRFDVRGQLGTRDQARRGRTVRSANKARKAKRGWR